MQQAKQGQMKTVSVDDMINDLLEEARKVSPEKLKKELIRLMNAHIYRPDISETWDVLDNIQHLKGVLGQIEEPYAKDVLSSVERIANSMNDYLEKLNALLILYRYGKDLPKDWCEKFRKEFVEDTFYYDCLEKIAQTAMLNKDTKLVEFVLQIFPVLSLGKKKTILEYLARIKHPLVKQEIISFPTTALNDDGFPLLDKAQRLVLLSYQQDNMGETQQNIATELNQYKKIRKSPKINDDSSFIEYEIVQLLVALLRVTQGKHSYTTHLYRHLECLLLADYKGAEKAISQIEFSNLQWDVSPDARKDHWLDLLNNTSFIYSITSFSDFSKFDGITLYLRKPLNEILYRNVIKKGCQGDTETLKSIYQIIKNNYKGHDDYLLKIRNALLPIVGNHFSFEFEEYHKIIGMYYSRPNIDINSLLKKENRKDKLSYFMANYIVSTKHLRQIPNSQMPMSILLHLQNIYREKYVEIQKVESVK
jgi:hypothetical protein